MITIFRGKVECPLCEGSGLIYKALIKNIEKIIYICDECEALWEYPEEISATGVIRLSSFLNRYGLSYDQCILNDLGYDWYR